MRSDRVRTPSRLSIPPIFWRKIHKWVGLILGLQFVIWTVSGALMALLDMDKVGGHSTAAPSEVSAGWPSDLLPISGLGVVEALALKRIVDRPVYEVVRGGELTLLDARTGAELRIDAALAAAIAKQAFHHQAPVHSAQLIQKPNLEAREYAGPMWRVNFADDENSSSYISAASGAPLVNRGDTWRTWDFVWMLHNMDYANRTSFNHPLIVFMAFGTLWLSFTGFYLLFKSFRRRDFNWVLGKQP